MSKKLLQKIRACTACKSSLPYPPRPILNFSANSKIIIIGQAPGKRVHDTSVPWNDPSGERLREWLNVSSEAFYDTKNFAIVPMGFCYPGNDGKGDNPPRPECAELWMEDVMQSLKQRQLILLIGQYSQKYFLHNTKKKTLTETVKHYKDYLPDYFVLPHPSPRNNIWLKKNPWFMKKNISELRTKIDEVLDN